MSKWICIVFGLAFASRAACAPEPVDRWKPLLRQVDAVFEKFAAEKHVPGLIYGVVRDGNLTHVHEIGVQDLNSKAPVSVDTVFRIASLTKSFTALAVLNLRDKGRLDLDTTVARYVPELHVLPLRGADPAPVRLRQLLHHAAGLVTDDPWADRQLDMSESELSRLLSEGIPLAQSPGGEFEYSNMGYALLGRAISTASGHRYQDYVTQVLLRPLGMTSTVWDPRHTPAEKRAIGYSWIDDHFEEQPLLSDGAFASVAGLNSTAKDYGRFVAWLLSAWSSRRVPIPTAINTELVREAARGAILSRVGKRPDGPDDQACPVAWMYGAGFYVVTDCELGTMLRHPGGLPGFGSQVLLLPEAGVGIFAFANLTYAHLSDPVVSAAVLLKRAGLLTASSVQISPALAQAANTVLRIYQAGDVGVGRSEFADNLLLDESAERRNAQLHRTRQSSGTCTSIAPAMSAHALAGRFRLACERGSLEVTIALAPTTLSKIQYLEFQLKPET